MKIYESLIELALSEDPNNHQLFHLYHDLDEKLNALEWFWDHKANQLPYKVEISVAYWGEIYEISTKFLFNFYLNSNTTNKTFSVYMVKKYAGGEYTFSPMGFSGVKRYFKGILIDNHNNFHK